MAPCHHLQPSQREEASGPCSNQRPLVEGFVGEVGIVHHLFVVDGLQHMLHGHDDLEEDDKEYDGAEIAVAHDFPFEEGVRVALRADHQCGKCEACRCHQQAHGAGMPPLEPVAVVEDIGTDEEEECPSGSREPVDALQRYTTFGRHGAERPRQQDLRDDDGQHEADDEPMHHGPMEVEGKPGRKPSRTLNGGEEDDVEQGEEHPEVAAGRHPQLDVRHALEGALYLGTACCNADHPHDGQRKAVHGEQVGNDDDAGRYGKQELVREVELHPEEYGKPYGHAGKRAVEQESHILAHPRMFAYHVVHRAEIYAAAELETECLQDINPRTDALGDPFAEHGHGEGRNLFSHIGYRWKWVFLVWLTLRPNTVSRILRSCLRVDAAKPRSG